MMSLTNNVKIISTTRQTCQYTLTNMFWNTVAAVSRLMVNHKSHFAVECHHCPHPGTLAPWNCMQRVDALRGLDNMFRHGSLFIPVKAAQQQHNANNVFQGSSDMVAQILTIQRLKVEYL